uniref:Uncharacterized protein n=1 Tax=viral metagenome TaxID=1070528 RepID=A0A6C0DKH3_9ZZZZ
MEGYSFRIFVGQKNALMLYDSYTIYHGTGAESGGGGGYQGPQGPAGGGTGAGTQGFQGLQGLMGLQGNIGFQGLIGTQGIQGGYGFQGLQGNVGVQGSQGLIGTQGIQGGYGFQGLQGNIGLQGSQGLQGLIGFTGARGFQGLQGFQGTQGLVGPTGSGFQGLEGPQGPAGPEGLGGSSTGYIDIYHINNAGTFQISTGAFSSNVATGPLSVTVGGNVMTIGGFTSQFPNSILGYGVNYTAGTSTVNFYRPMTYLNTTNVQVEMYPGNQIILRNLSTANMGAAVNTTGFPNGTIAYTGRFVFTF